MNRESKFKPFLWPDRAIGKRESRRIREEHNALLNSHAELLEALQYAVQWLSVVPPQYRMGKEQLEQARAAIAKATGGAA